MKVFFRYSDGVTTMHPASEKQVANSPELCLEVDSALYSAYELYRYTADTWERILVNLNNQVPYYKETDEQ